MEPANTATEELLVWLNGPDREISVRLAKNQFAAPLETLTLADFVECDFPGYAPFVKPVFHAAAVQGDFHANTETEMLQWVAGSITQPQEITAVYVVGLEAGVTALIDCYILDTPQVMFAEGHMYQKRVRIEGINVPD